MRRKQLLWMQATSPRLQLIVGRYESARLVCALVAAAQFPPFLCEAVASHLLAEFMLYDCGEEPALECHQEPSVSPASEPHASSEPAASEREA
jgi:hypothetical protein